MKKLFFGAIFLALVIVVPVPSMAGININIGIALPPPIGFAAPPDVVVLPDAPDVYVVPGIEADLFFWDGWWWRLWEGRWYRSRYYSRGWAYYDEVPSFYFDVDPGWRRYYKDHDWHGYRWDYERIPARRLRQNWKNWQKERHWEKQRNWGVREYHPRVQNERQELRHQRQRQYDERPDVRKSRQQREELLRQFREHQQQQQPGARQPRGERQREERGGHRERER